MRSAGRRSFCCLTRPTAGNQTKANRSVEYDLSELDRHEFPGLLNLVDIIQDQGAKAEVYDREGDTVKAEGIEERCREASAPLPGTIIVIDGNTRVWKRYRTEDLCGETVRLRKDFAYKNPYQF